MKDWQKRLRETITFIGNCNSGTSQQRNAVKSLLETWNTTQNEAHRKNTSVSLSQGKSEGKAETPFRKYRRALLLVNHALILRNADSYKLTVDGYGNSQLESKLAEELQVVLLKEGNAALLAEKLNELKTTPFTFLEQNVLSISVRADDTGGENTFKFYYRLSGDGTGFFRLCDSRQYPSGNAENCDVIVVPAQEFKDYQDARTGNQTTGINGTLADANGGPHVLVTTEFTGCAFCFQGDGSKLMAAHMNPNERETSITPTTVRDYCASDNGKGFAGTNVPTGDFHAYGRTGDRKTGYLGQPEGGKEMTIIGIYSDTPKPMRWRLYSQQRMANGKVHVDQIHPKET